MAVVLDANQLVALANDDARAPAVTRLLERWSLEREQLHAPALLRYEVASALTQLVAAEAFHAERLSEAWRTVQSVPITYHPLQDRGDEVVSIALRLRRRSAYDAAYIELAERLDAELWTLDDALARNAVGIGFPVRLID